MRDIFPATPIPHGHPRVVLTITGLRGSYTDTDYLWCIQHTVLPPPGKRFTFFFNCCITRERTKAINQFIAS